MLKRNRHAIVVKLCVLNAYRMSRIRPVLDLQHLEAVQVLVCHNNFLLAPPWCLLVADFWRRQFSKQACSNVHVLGINQTDKLGTL